MIPKVSRLSVCKSGFPAVEFLNWTEGSSILQSIRSSFFYERFSPLLFMARGLPPRRQEPNALDVRRAMAGVPAAGIPPAKRPRITLHAPAGDDIIGVLSGAFLLGAVTAIIFFWVIVHTNYFFLFFCAGFFFSASRIGSFRPPCRVVAGSPRSLDGLGPVGTEYQDGDPQRVRIAPRRSAEDRFLDALSRVTCKTGADGPPTRTPPPTVQSTPQGLARSHEFCLYQKYALLK